MRKQRQKRREESDKGWEKKRKNESGKKRLK